LLALAATCLPIQAAPLHLAVTASPLSAPVFIADKLGYFAQEGVQLTLDECGSGAACLKLMLDGKAQLATVSDLPIMFNAFERKDFVVLASFCNSNADTKLISRKASNISQPKDLVDKHIALTPGTSGQYVFDLFALSQSMDPRTLTVSSMPPDDIVHALMDKKIDVAVVFEPYAYKLMQSLGAEAQRMSIDTPYTLSFNLVAQKSSVQKQEADINRLLHALDRAVQYIQANPTQSQAIVLERLKLEHSFMAWTWDDLRFKLVLGHSLLTSLESEARWAIRENLVHSQIAPNFLEVIDPGPLRKVKPGGVTLVK
jgi:NitT/TauT family transport system substrate-binding protein